MNLGHHSLHSSLPLQCCSQIKCPPQSHDTAVPGHCSDHSLMYNDPHVHMRLVNHQSVHHVIMYEGFMSETFLSSFQILVSEEVS